MIDVGIDNKELANKPIKTSETISLNGATFAGSHNKFKSRMPIMEIKPAVTAKPKYFKFPLIQFPPLRIGLNY